jgi:gamma-glutamylaminecyclotransferase
MTHLVFVYGTLKRGFPNYPAYMQSAQFVGTCRTAEKYPLVLSGDRHVPCLLDTPGKGSEVSGELYRVDEAGLQHLDDLEAVGRPGGYLRRAIEVFMDGKTGSRRQKALAYLMKPENVPDARSGWLSTYTLADALKYRRKGAKAQRHKERE